MKKILVAVLTVMLLTVGVSAAFFEKTVSFAEGTFSDVAANAWYAKDVQSSYEFGLVNGVGGGKFDPNGTVTVAQAVTLAARFNAAYNNKTIGTGGDKWYSANVDYAVQNGIMTATQFDNYDRAAKRHEVATLFAAALPEEYFKPLNTVFGIPDVAKDKSYYNALMTLYKAGIAMGSDAKGTFNPDSNITRAEFSALINRVAAPGYRLAKTFDSMPREDSHLLANAPSMGYTFMSRKFSMPNGWLADNKNLESMTDGQVTSNVGDESKEDYSALYRDFDELKSGRITLEFYGTLCSPDNGIHIGFADANNKLYAGIKTDYGVLSLFGAETVKTNIKVPPTDLEEYAIILTLDLDRNTMYAFINGVKTPDVMIPADIGISRLVLGSTVEGTGSLNPMHVKLYQNYALAERFLIVDGLAGSEPYSMNVYGNITVEEQAGSVSREDRYAAKITAKAGSENIASRGFAAVSEKGVFEAYVLLPDGADGAFFTITSANADVVKIYSKDGAWYVGDKKMRDFTANVWQVLRIETDAAAKKAVIKICGKTVGEVAISAQYIDGVKIGFNPDKDGVMWFDDITAYNYIDHADYPAVPKANNDDGYNIGVNECNLWADNVTQEGWQAVSAFAEIEPWLGYYDEGSPELADWEIKIMAEHGIDFRNFCWYSPFSVVTAPMKESYKVGPAIHDGYMNAKYSDMVKFCIFWDNTTVAKTSVENFKEYIWNYWREYYFSDSRYMTLDNKPLFIIWSIESFNNMFGGAEKAAEVIEFMKNDMKGLGYDGMVVLTRNDAGEQIGADGTFIYHHYRDGASADYQIQSLTTDKAKNFHVIPTLSMGHNDIGRNNVRSPLISLEGHKEVAEYIKKDYLGTENTGTWKDNTLFVATWNEFSEGHYICPSGEFGYGYLETVKDVFTNDKSDHTSLDIKPTDAQKERITKMYPDNHHMIRNHLTIDPATTLEYKPLVTWDFSDKKTLEGWKLQNFDVIENTSTGVKLQGAIPDVQMYKYNSDIDISEKPFIHIRMKTPEINYSNTSHFVSPYIYIFFTTEANPTLEGAVKVANKALSKDGKTTDYYIDMSSNKEWTGTLKTIRFDPLENTLPFEIELFELVLPVDQKADVYANGIKMDYSFPAVIEDGDVKVTAEAEKGFYTMLNLYYVWNRHEGTLYVESKKHSVKMTVGSDKALLDGKQIDLGFTLTLCDGLPVVKLGRLCELLGHNFVLEGNTMRITSTDRKPVVLDKGEYLGWDFDSAGYREGWLSYNMAVSVVNGKMYLNNPLEADCKVFMDGIEIETSKYAKLKVGMYADPEQVKDKMFQIFFRSESSGLSEKKSFIHYYDTTVMKKGELYEFEFDLASNPEWMGYVNNLRLDPFNLMADCAIDYMRFIPAEEEVVDDLSRAPDNYVAPSGVYEYNFDTAGEVKYWTPSGGLSVSNGMLSFNNPKSKDVQIYLENLGIDASAVSNIVIGIKASDNATKNNFLQVYFTTDSSGSYSEDKSFRYNYGSSGIPTNGVYPVTIELGKNSNWKGRVEKIRIDPFENQAELQIDYVIFTNDASGSSGNQSTATTEAVSAVYAYNFENPGEVKYWTPEGSLSLSNGMLAYNKPQSKDVKFFLDNLGLEASKADTVIIGIKGNKAAMQNNFMQMYFTTDSEPGLSEDKSVRHKYNVSSMTDGKVYEVKLDLKSNAKWKGIVNQIRIDPFEYQSEFEVDYVLFTKSGSSGTASSDDTTEKAPEQTPAVEVKSGKTPSGLYAYGFDSANEMKIWSPNGAVSVENGILAFRKPNGRDVQVIFENLAINANKAKKVTIGIAVNKSAMSSGMLQLYFTTDAEPGLSEDKSIKSIYKVSSLNEGEIYPLTLDLSTNAKWSGTVGKLRLDPFDSESEFYIDYIVFS